MKILLVDDLPAIIDIYGELLRSDGYEVVTAGSAIDALKLALAEQPDIGIIDYFLPDGNGAALTHSLLGAPETAHMLISLFSEVDHLRDALDAGAIDMISKNDPDDLILLRVRALARQVEQWHYQQSMRQIEQERDPDDPIRILLADDSLAIRFMYAELLRESGFQVEAVGSVKEALEVAVVFMPELAIIDYYMPDGNGDQLISSLLSDRRTQDVMPFILTDNEEVIEKSISAGAIDVLHKSDSQMVFLNRIQSMERYIRSQRYKVKLVEQLFQHVPVAMVEIAGQFVMQTNPGFNAIFGFSPYPGMEHVVLLSRMGMSEESVHEIERLLAVEVPQSNKVLKSWGYIGRDGASKQLELTLTMLPEDKSKRVRRQLLSISDVTALMDLNKAEEQARESELRQSWLCSILSSIPDGILVVGDEGEIQQTNPAALEMLGYSEEELIGTEMEMLFSDVEQEEVDRYLKRKDGSVVPVSLTTASLDSGDGEGMGGHVVVLHDLEALLSAESAERASKAKDEFLASMSHELRTPLTTIIGSSEILLESDLNQDQQGLLRVIEISSRRQLSLVNDILDLSKIESGKFEINHIEFDLDTLIDEIEHLFIAQAQGSKITFRTEKEVDFKYCLIGDGQRIGQVLINLLSNAFKFTSEGEVVLRVRQQDERLLLGVIDQGIGIPEDVLSRLFRPFEQADGSISRRFGGTGLGLHISKVLAELMGGEIEVSSVAGGGGCFQLSIPLLISEQAVVPQEKKRALTSEQFFGRVLLAEDTPEIQALMRRILGNVGVEVEVANNGQEAIDIVLSQVEPFDLILMDMQMPELNGIEATEMLRQLGYDVPIVALTANVMQKHRDQFETAGCNGFLSKPIDRQALFQVLGEYLQHGEGDMTVATEESWVDPELHEVFIKHAVQLREELKGHFNEEAWQEAREVSHSLKGSGATFGYPLLGDMGHAVCHALDLGHHEQVPKLIEKLLEELDQVINSDL